MHEDHHRKESLEPHQKLYGLLADYDEYHHHPLPVGHHELENKYELALSHMRMNQLFRFQHHINLQQYR